MPTINLLSQSTIDKIAAGEVVERPASVVKELLENAIDAGASAVTVELKEGGISLIRVTDNGCGIEKEQVKKAFLRHATSKITSIEDLTYVESLGFRGEALSSIAAVAQVEVITKTKEDLTGVKYSIAGGMEEDFEEIGAPSGTTFLIHNLFYNTPARKKFLKQPQTEAGYVADLMEHIALSKPEISVKFVNNGQVRFHTSGNGDLKEVIYRIYGKEMADAVIPFEADNEFCHVKGYIGKPEINRSNRNFEIYFMNGRFIKDDIISKAIEEGYRQYVMQHKFPFVVLHIEMQPQEIDVNVHPSKMQIRIHKGNEVYQFLSEAIKERLSRIEMIPRVVLTEEKETQKDPLKTPEPFEVKRIENMVKEEIPVYDISGGRKLEKSDVVQASTQQIPQIKDSLQKVVTSRVFGAETNDKSYKNEGIHANVIKAGEHILVERPAQLNLFEEKILSKDARNEYRIMGQIFDTYWLIAFQDKLLIIDQHAAHEKVKYERLVKELKEKQVSSQMLNPPLILSLTGKETQLLKDCMPHFETMGFEIEEFGSDAYAVRSMPVDLYGHNEKELFTEILDELSENPLKGTPDVILDKLASMACKAAVKGNNSMSTEEMESLIDELLTLDNPYHCPHGRPTIISMSKYEIEKKFKRII
ncbi:MAG: DNA mismatch repair endonuclease MutL [Lachnospiraceae bacterium]|nr:DNA mismatch repair endonuclease MutL [Lachnospiraceae bacterium]